MEELCSSALLLSVRGSAPHSVKGCPRLSALRLCKPGDPPPFDIATPDLADGQGFTHARVTLKPLTKEIKMTFKEIYGFRKDIHEISEQIIEHHIIVNQTSLINAIFASGTEVCGITWDNVTATYRNPPYDEIMEWWLVSDWLSRHLYSQGKFILNTDIHNYWGRCTSGQSIILDGVIQELVMQMEGGK